MEVTVRHTSECYHQLAVKKGNESLFLSPRTHILTQAGTQITCDAMMPSMYQLGKAWYSFFPKPVIGLSLSQIKPLTKTNWEYANPGELAVSGIYSQLDLEKLRDLIMFPAEKAAILNNMARRITGEPTIDRGFSITTLLDEAAWDEITKNTWDRMWNSFITFGTLSAGFIGVIIIFRMIKLIADTIIHGYALHTIYGWSIHLPGAIWSSVTNLLLHLGKANKQGNNGNEEIRRPPESSYVAGKESHSNPSHQFDASRILPKPSVHHTLSRV